MRNEGSDPDPFVPDVITFDYWDTIVVAESLPERVRERREVLRQMLLDIGHDLPQAEFERLYKASAAEADRWWREEHRGYRTEDRIRWLLGQLAIERPEACEHIARAVDAVDQTLIDHPPELIEGAAEGLRALSRHYRLAIVSDTGFASGRAQDRLLALYGLRELFTATVYSMDVGHAKPRPEPFLAALSSLGAPPERALHVGDIERTDIVGALGVGMRAVRADFLRPGGSSAAEYVVTRFEELIEYLRPEAMG